jgi:hypothetical protein
MIAGDRACKNAIYSSLLWRKTAAWTAACSTAVTFPSDVREQITDPDATIRVAET